MSDVYEDDDLESILILRAYAHKNPFSCAVAARPGNFVIATLKEGTSVTYHTANSSGEMDPNPIPHSQIERHGSWLGIFRECNGYRQIRYILQDLFILQIHPLPWTTPKEYDLARD